MVGEITTVWTEIMTWVTTALGNVQTVFYANDKLTFIGTLCIVGVSVSISLLAVGIVQNFLKLRG